MTDFYTKMTDFISIFLATRGQFERVVLFWSPTEYSSVKKDYDRVHR